MLNNYILLPRAECPKYILPIDTKGLFTESLKFYTPYLRSRMLAIDLLHSLSSMRLLKYVARGLVLDGTRLPLIIPQADAIQGLIVDEFKSKKVVCAYYTGRKGRYVVQIMDQSAQVLGYAKVIITCIAHEDNKQESRMLSKLTKRQFRSFVVPRVRNFIATTDVNILVMNPPESMTAVSPTRIANSHVRMLVELFRHHMKTGIVYESRHFHSIAANIASLSNKIKRQIYEHALEVITPQIRGDSMPLGFCHGDYKPWNIRLLPDNRLYVFDWEMAHEQWLPLWDYFHFILQTNILIRRKSARSLMHIVEQESSKIEPYLREFSIKREQYLYLLVMYILDISASYYSTGRVYDDQEAEFYITRIYSLLLRLLEYLNQ